jgi:hypothetical protein
MKKIIFALLAFLFLIPLIYFLWRRRTEDERRKDDDE